MNRMKKSGYVTTTDVDQSKIKAGLYIINREDNQRVVKFYCNCGNNKDEMRDVTYSTHITHTCSECGNQYFLRSHDNNKVTRMGGFYSPQRSYNSFGFYPKQFLSQSD